MRGYKLEYTDFLPDVTFFTYSSVRESLVFRGCACENMEMWGEVRSDCN